MMDPVSRGWPTCIQGVAAAALLVEEVRKHTFGGKMTVYTSHSVSVLLTQTAHRWLTDSRILKYETILMVGEDLQFAKINSCNPAQFLYGSETEREVEHDCVELTDLQTKTREDLCDTPLGEGYEFYIDGSARCVDGMRRSGYAIIEGNTWKVVGSTRLPGSWSAQSCELYALQRALRILEKKIGTIYTDSKYAYGVVHTFGKIWKERGLITSRGKELAHEQMITLTLEALTLPQEIAVVYIPSHQRGDTPTAIGNRLANEEAKRAAMQQEVRLLTLIPIRQGIKKAPIFTAKEEKDMAQLGASQLPDGTWKTPDGRMVLNKEITRNILKHLHHQSHWGTQALCDTVLREYVCKGIYTLAQQEVQNCHLCTKINKKVMRTGTMGGQPLAIRPFQRIQIDFTELPQVQRWKYLLVIIDHFTRWVEAFPTINATASTIARLLLEQIIPRYGIMDSIDSDRGPHFSSKIQQLICNALQVSWKLHTPWHPQSSGRVERMNGTLKMQLTKLMVETKMPWIKCLPLALLRIRTAPRKDVGLSPYEMMFGLPFWSTVEGCPTLGEGDIFVRNYLQALSRSLTDLRKRGLLAQTPPLDFSLHKVEPGDWILIKTWKTEKFQPQWEGPYQVLLTTEAAARTREKGWTHASRFKGPVEAPQDPDTNSDWTCVPGEKPLTLRFRRKT
ncbi:protein NYNRIN-like [Narcine bancroftii]|uniref:protein NYNRIN-like n=1 Tax=Narcine bancroftii TaxID=1343680 RepID=UPI0038322BD9